MSGPRVTGGRAPRQGGDLPSMPAGIALAGSKPRARVDRKRLFFIFLGLALFCLVHFSPAWPDAVDPEGTAFQLTWQGKAALGLFLLAATWWVFEVVPIGVTSITIAVVQALFLIRPDRLLADGDVISGTWIAFTDFFAPSVWFIFASIMFGLTFATALTLVIVPVLYATFYGARKETAAAG